MNCQIAKPEEYDLWSLGLLEESPAAEIAAHIQNGCDTCCSNVRRSLTVWAALAYAYALEGDDVPTDRLRARVVALAHTGKRRNLLEMPWPRWMVTGFAAAAMITIVVTSYRGFYHTPQLPDEHLREIARLTSDVELWRRRAETRISEAAPARNTPPAPVPTPAPERVAPLSRALEQELATLSLDASRTADALNAERARTAQQQQELDSLRAAAAATAALKDEAERKLNAALRDPSVAAKDRTIATLTTRVRQLEDDNARYRETVLRMSQQMNRDTQLVALLNSPSVQLVQLRGSEAGGKATARAFLIDGKQVLFSASNLPALPQGRTYQLWLLRGRQPAIASGGTFSGDGLVQVSDRAVLTDLRGLAVTEEPAGGSPGPTGHKILVGTVKTL